MSVEKGDNMFWGCQQHLLSQVDTAGNTELKEKEIRKRGGGRRVGKGDTDFDNYFKREWASFREVNYSHEW